MSATLDLAPLRSDDPRVDWPLFTITEAAWYLGVPASTLYTWVRPATGEPLVYSYAKLGHQASIPFVGFAEAFVLSAARRAGLRPRRIRQNVEAIKRDIGIDHALATHRIYHDRTELLVRISDDDRDLMHGGLEVARNRQAQLSETVRNQLECITYAGDGFATTISLSHTFKTNVIVDTAEAFGQPIVERTGTRVKDVLSLYRADEPVSEIAYGFDLTTDEVLDLIRAHPESAT